ncbi:hypothetical protein EYC84_000342 [Monilinia fructicola]|uniref:Uncharacterized protein n=1 Tax=Monilinia fructicola TaxID=38448 RepID=A0A5M9JQJ0_MONFR|nr:hypothetical protein EYC84_000342 [Monilinia fructicola]
MENLHTCIISFQFSVYILVFGFSNWCIRAMVYDSEGLVDEWDESTPSSFLADRSFNLLSLVVLAKHSVGYSEKT